MIYDVKNDLNEAKTVLQIVIDAIVLGWTSGIGLKHRSEKVWV